MTNDLTLAKLCKLAYAKHNEAIEAYKEMGFTYVDGMDGLFILDTPTERIFVFRGSDNLRDWVDNVNVGRNIIGIHKGFDNHFVRFVPLLEKHTNTLKLNSFTGHSLGGAMASIWWPDDRVVTFGQPMITNIDTTVLDGSFTRYVNNMDIVPRLPSKALGYKHFGKLVYLDYYGNKHENPSKWQIIKDRLRSRFKAITKWQKFDDFYDHRIEEYISKLEQSEGVIS